MTLPGICLDQKRMLQDARELAFPRYSGSEGDGQAIAWVARKLQEAGLTVNRQTFSYDMGRAWTALRLLLLGSAVAVGVAGFLASRHPGSALLILGMALVAGTILFTWSPWLEKLYQKPGTIRTANIEARRSGESKETRTITLILLAHHDSKSQSLTLPWRALLTHLAGLGSLALAIHLTVPLLSGDGEVSGPWPQLLGILACLSLLVLATLRNGNESPGGVDNAGSVAILLELARKLPDRVPEEVELVFLSTGAEEDHMVGAMRWLEENRKELEAHSTLALNLDGAGNPGTVALLERYGFGKKLAPTLSRQARIAANRLDIRVRGVYLPPALGVDAIPFVHRGIECLTLASGSLNRATLSVHSKNDIADHLDGPTLERVARLAVGIVDEVGKLE